MPNDDTVTFYDLDTKKFAQIPRSELAPGMIRARVEDHDGEVWLDPNKLKPSEYRHDPFKGDVRELIMEIRDSFPNVYEHDYDFWEDGFRRDANPAQEIAIWLRISKTYKKFATNHALPYRTDLFRLLVGCTNSNRETVQTVVPITEIPDSDQKEIIDAFYPDSSRGD